jgi:hypothetical protein
MKMQVLRILASISLLAATRLENDIRAQRNNWSPFILPKSLRVFITPRAAVQFWCEMTE